MTIKITNISKTLRGIREESITQLLPPALAETKDDVAAKTKQIFLRYFENHPAVQGLNGAFADQEEKDVQAILGVSNEDSYDAITEMLEAIDLALRVEFQTRVAKGQKGGGRFATRGEFSMVIYTEELESAIRSIPSATYISEKSGILIPWLDWLLDGARTKAEITFNVDADEGRTGRALMINNNYGWSITKDEFNNKKGVNFIEEIAQDENFRKETEEVFKEAVEEAIARYAKS